MIRLDVSKQPLAVCGKVVSFWESKENAGQNAKAVAVTVPAIAELQPALNVGSARYCQDICHPLLAGFRTFVL